MVEYIANLWKLREEFHLQLIENKLSDGSENSDFCHDSNHYQWPEIMEQLYVFLSRIERQQAAQLAFFLELVFDERGAERRRIYWWK